MIAPNPHHVRWPAERFYWGVIDGGALSAVPAIVNRHRNKTQLRFIFESVAPIAVDEMQIVFAPLPGRSRWLGCGVDRVAIEQVLNSGAITLTPDDLPAMLDASERVDTRSLNLLVDECEPQPVKIARRRWLTLTIALTAIATTLAALGMEARRARTLKEVAAHEERINSIYGDAVGDVAERPGAQPAAMVFLGELRRLRQTRDPHISIDTTAPNAAIALGSVLSVWPGAVDFQCESLAVTPDVITISGRVPSNADAQTFIAAFAALNEWTPRQPQVGANRDDVRLTLRLERRQITTGGAN